MSNRKAAQALGVSHTLISRYAKSVNGFFSPRLGVMVSVNIINVDKLSKVKHPAAKKYSILNLNLSFPKGKICAISSDLSKIEGVFGSFQEAANFFKVSDYRRIRRYFGTQKLINTFKGNFYFSGDSELIKYYETKKSIPNKSIIVHDLTETSSSLSTSFDVCTCTSSTKVYYFISVNQAEKELKIHHNFIKKHLEKGTVYIGQDGRKFRFLRPHPGPRLGPGAG